MLEDTGGISGHLKTIVSFMQKETGAIILSSPDPSDLLDRLEQVYRTQILPRNQELMAGRNPHGTAEGP